MNTLELLKVKNRITLNQKNYTPQQIAAKFGEVEAEIKSAFLNLLTEIIQMLIFSCRI